MNAYDSEGRSTQSSSEEEVLAPQELRESSVNDPPQKPARKSRLAQKLVGPVVDTSIDTKDESSEASNSAICTDNMKQQSQTPTETSQRKMPHRYAKRKFNNTNVKMNYGSTPNLRSPIDVFTKENIYENVMSTFGTPSGVGTTEFSSTPNLFENGERTENVLSTFMTPKAHRKHDGYCTDNEISSNKLRQLHRTPSVVSLPGTSHESVNVFEQNWDDDDDNIVDGEQNDRSAPSPALAEPISNNTADDIDMPGPAPRRKKLMATENNCSTGNSAVKEPSPSVAAHITNDMLLSVKLRSNNSRAVEVPKIPLSERATLQDPQTPVTRRPRSPLKRRPAFYGGPVSTLTTDDILATKCNSLNRDKRKSAPESGRSQMVAAEKPLKTAKSEADILTYHLGGGDLYYVATPEPLRKEYDTGYETNMESGYTSEASIRSRTRGNDVLEQEDKQELVPGFHQSKLQTSTLSMSTIKENLVSEIRQRALNADEKETKADDESTTFGQQKILQKHISQSNPVKNESQIVHHIQSESTENEIFPWDISDPVKQDKSAVVKSETQKIPMFTPKSPKMNTKGSKMHLSTMKEVFGKDSVPLRASSVDAVDNSIPEFTDLRKNNTSLLKATSVDDTDNSTISHTSKNNKSSLSALSQAIAKSSAKLKATSVDNVDISTRSSTNVDNNAILQVQTTSFQNAGDIPSTHKETKTHMTALTEAISKRGCQLRGTSVDSRSSSNENKIVDSNIEESTTNLSQKQTENNTSRADHIQMIEQEKQKPPPTAPKTFQKSAAVKAIENLKRKSEESESKIFDNNDHDEYNADTSKNTGLLMEMRERDLRAVKHQHQLDNRGTNHMSHTNGRNTSTDREVDLKRSDVHCAQSMERDAEFAESRFHRDQSNDSDADYRRNFAYSDKSNDREAAIRKRNARRDQSYDRETNLRSGAHQNDNTDNRQLNTGRSNGISNSSKPTEIEMTRRKAQAEHSKYKEHDLRMRTYGRDQPKYKDFKNSAQYNQSNDRERDGRRSVNVQDEMISDDEEKNIAPPTRRPRGRTGKLRHNYSRSVGTSDYALSSSETEADAVHSGHHSDPIYGVCQPPEKLFQPPCGSRYPGRLEMHMMYNPRNDYVDASRYADASEYYRELNRECARYEKARKYYSNDLHVPRQQQLKPQRWSAPALYNNGLSMAEYNSRDGWSSYYDSKSEFQGRSAQRRIPYSGDWSPAVQRRGASHKTDHEWPQRARRSCIREDVTDWSPEMPHRTARRSLQEDDDGWKENVGNKRASTLPAIHRVTDWSLEDPLSDEETLKQFIKSHGHIGGKTAKRLEALKLMLKERDVEKHKAASEEGIYNEIYETVPLRKQLKHSQSANELDSALLPEGVTSANELRRQLKPPQPGRTLKEVKQASRASRAPPGMYEKQQSIHKSKSVTSLATTRTAVSQARSTRSTRATCANPNATFREKPIKQWTQKDVADWLTSLKLKKFKPCLRHIDGPKVVIMAKQKFPGLSASFSEMAMMQQSLSKMKHGTGY